MSINIESTMSSDQQTLLDLDSDKNFPMLIEYANGGQDIVTCANDIPCNCDFFVLKTNCVLEGRTIAGSNLTKQ